METFISLLAVIAGLVLRLAIPIAITAVAIYVLRHLDARWQSEGASEASLPVVEKPRCWETNNCTPEMRASCPGYLSKAPCWQARRKENGYLQDKCLECDIFLKAPVPTQN
jgi:hypothetical protein